ncbi:MAG: T9SS type A sorting domain-containing protein, partial [Bacteroidota bacterium]
SATLNLTVKSTSSSTTNLSICPSDLPYLWNGLTFTSAGTQTKTGFTNAVGCDSSATLNLTVKSTSSSTTNVSICPSDLPYVWNGLTFTAAGTQTKTGFTNAVGCDSSATMNLTIKSTSSSTTNVSICPSDLPYVWNGLTFTSAGTQTKTGLTNAVGCDSTATLNLTVNSNPVADTILGPQTSLYPVTNYTYTVTQQLNTSYNWTIQNGIIVSGQGTNSVIVQWINAGTGQIQVEVTSAQGCKDSSALNLSVLNVGVQDIDKDHAIQIYPNPTKSSVKLKVDNRLIGKQYRLTDTKGKVVLSGVITVEDDIIDLDELSNGMYFLTLVNHLSQPIKLIKQK